MQAGDIVFVRGKGFVSNLIRFFDKGEFTHVSIAVSPTSVIESQRFVKTQIVPMDYQDYEILRFPMTSEQREQCIVEAHRLVGARYDYAQIFWYLAKKLFRLKNVHRNNNPNTLICSELVSRILYAVGLVEESDTLYELTPNQLYDYLQYLMKNRRPE